MVPRHLVPALASVANIAIDKVLINGAVLHGQNKPSGEVGFVAAFVLGGITDVAKAWRRLLKPHNLTIKVNGVFCHQSPEATFTDSKGQVVSCELADLLIVVDDLTAGSPQRRRAALIQAKMAAPRGGQTLTKRGDLRQLDLLTNWPTFTLPANFTPGPRNIKNCQHAGSLSDCAWYGLISPQPNPLWHQQAPATSMPAGGDLLGTFLARMVEAGQLGYGREATGTADDWSRTVHDLMTTTYASYFNYATGFTGSRQRGHSALTFMGTAVPYPFWVPFSLRHGRPPPSGARPDGSREEGPGPGISIVRIGIGSTRAE